MTKCEDAMIVIESQQYGKLEVQKEQVYLFEKTIIGIPDHHEYALVGVDQSAFFTLHSLDGSICFHLVLASNVVKDYEFTIDEETVKQLEASSPEQIVVFLIVNVVDNRLHVNLKAPILMVPDKQKGCQYIISEKDYPIRLPLHSEENS